MDNFLQQNEITNKYQRSIINFLDFSYNFKFIYDNFLAQRNILRIIFEPQPEYGGLSTDKTDLCDLFYLFSWSLFNYRL